MNAEAFVLMIGRDSLVLSLGIVATLLLRRLLRGAGGAALLPWCWTLPAALLTALHLPDWPAIATTGITGQMPPQLMHFLSGARDDATHLARLWPAVFALWLAGLLLISGAQWLRHRRYIGTLRREGETWRSPAGSNPGLLGLWQPGLVLPGDFEQRFDAEEQALVIAHEEAHRRRLDNPIQLAALLVCLLHWFNPLAWWGLSRLQRDQELACDAAVLRQASTDWRRYSQALLKAQDRYPAVPLVATWRSTHPLVERIDMLKQSQGKSSRLARLAARGLLLACVTAGVGTAMALKAEAPKAAGNRQAATPAASQPDIREVCPGMARPMPAGKLPQGSFDLVANFTVGTSGQVSAIEVSGEAAFRPMVESAISRYRCVATPTERRMEQKFHFKID